MTTVKLKRSESKIAMRLDSTASLSKTKKKSHSDDVVEERSEEEDSLRTDSELEGGPDMD